MLSCFSHAWLCVTLWIIISQVPLSMGFLRQEHWSGLPFPFPMHESEIPQSCLTLCNPMDCSPPGSSARGISQARTLEWVAISSSRGSSQPKLLSPALAGRFLSTELPGKLKGLKQKSVTLKKGQLEGNLGTSSFPLTSSPSSVQNVSVKAQKKLNVQNSRNRFRLQAQKL